MSSNEVYRLADSTVVEPLINNWAVWSDLISPATYSLHLMNYQLKTLSSYLDNPQLHLKACRNPKLIGGPFVDVPEERSGEVKELLRKTEESHRENLKLARAITEFYDLLNKEARGQGMTPFYREMPEELRGYAELLYDYYNHPIVRLLENFLYESPYYRRELQAVRILEQRSDHSRPFFLSTPRLPNEGEVEWAIPFANPQLDELFKLDSAPRSLAGIGDAFGFEGRQLERLEPLLSGEPAARAGRYEGPGVRIRYFGHACVLIEWNGVSILTDPWLGVRSTEGGRERFSYDDLPERIDYALITHGHHDHFVPETLLRLRHRIGCLVVPRTFGLFYTDPSLKLLAHRLGFRQVVELEALESIPVPGGEIMAIPFLGEHADLPHGKSGYLTRTEKTGILFAADSNCLDPQLYRHLRRAIGPIETVFLGMECVGAPLSWLYGALVPAKLPHNLDQTRRTNGSDSRAALELVEAVGGKRVYVYAMGNEPWLQYGMGLGLPEGSPQVKEADRLLATVRAKGFVDAQRPFCQFELHL